MMSCLPSQMLLADTEDRHWIASLQHGCNLLNIVLYYASDSDTLENAPSLEEVHMAIGKLCNGWAAGLDGISTELLKCAKEHRSVLCTIPCSQRSGSQARSQPTGKVPLSFLCTRAKGLNQTVPATDLYLCCLYLAQCSLMLSSRDYNGTTTATSTTASTSVWIHSRSLNGRCCSCSAASVRAAQRIFKASAGGLCGQAAFRLVDKVAL